MGRRKKGDGCLTLMVAFLFYFVLFVGFIAGIAGIILIALVLCLILYTVRRITKSKKTLSEDAADDIDNSPNEYLTPAASNISAVTAEIKNNVLNGFDLYTENAARRVIEENRASVGFIQREFNVDFNRARQIMNQLYELGVVGKENGIEPREILMDKEALERLLGNPNTPEAPTEKALENIDSVKEQTEKPIENRNTVPKSNTNLKKKYSREFIEHYARCCNAYLEHQDEMEQYEQHESSLK